MKKDSLNLSETDVKTEVFFDDETKKEKEAINKILKSIPKPQNLSAVMLDAGNIPVFISDIDIDNYSGC